MFKIVLRMRMYLSQNIHNLTLRVNCGTNVVGQYENFQIDVLQLHSTFSSYLFYSSKIYMDAARAGEASSTMAPICFKLVKATL